MEQKCVQKLLLFCLFSIYALESVAVNTEEALLGRRLSIHPIEAAFKEFMSKEPVRDANAILHHHEVIARFCDEYGSLSGSGKEEMGGCTFEEYYACLENIRKPFINFFDPGRMQVKPETVMEHWYSKENPPRSCRRISKPTMEEFMGFVVRSEPVIITDWASEWKGLEQWSWDLLLSEIPDEPVAVSSM